MNRQQLTTFLTLGAGVGCALGAISGIFIGNITLGVAIGIPMFCGISLLLSAYFDQEQKQ